eukprot:COSAG02_NODE_1115_length_14499_cov_46.098958_8_plen_38_part_00
MDQFDRLEIRLFSEVLDAEYGESSEVLTYYYSSEYDS